jgi:hypothetical protein
MKVRGWILVLLLVAAPAAAQTCPPFPARGVQIIDALYNPALAMGTDDQRRQLTHTFLEQFVFEFPSEGWTWKSADPGRPPSKDSISRLVAGRLCNWDWQNGSTRQRSVQAGQIGEDITGQNPIPVGGVNHLIDVPSPQPPTPSPQPIPSVQTDLTPVKGWIDVAVANAVQTLYAQNERIHADAVARDAGIVAEVRAASNKPGAMEQTFGNRYVQIALAALGTLLTTQAVK